MSIIPFTYGDQPVRVVSVDGEPWFVLNDLCAVLGLARSASQIKDRLDGGVRQTYPLPTAGGVQQTTIVSEPGMYEVVIRSDKPEAVNFRRWITSEVLPSIRRHGGYLTPEATEAALTDPDFIIRMATTIKEERARRAVAEERAAELAAPAAAWDVMVAASGDYAVADAAKMLSRDPAIEIGRDRLFAYMHDAGWIYRHQGRRPGWRARQSQVDLGRLVEKANAAFQNRVTGEMESALPTIRITPKGLGELHKRLGGIEPLSPVAVVA